MRPRLTAPPGNCRRSLGAGRIWRTDDESFGLGAMLAALRTCDANDAMLCFTR
jgi:hypothetical protein